jgi:EmrB/QacA subfamily drug resistance transporter
VLVIVIVSFLMIILDISIVITGLPKIQAAFDFTPTGLSWVHSAYTLAFGSLLLLGARAGDLLGRRRMFVVGLAVFTSASFLIGLAPTAAVLIGARAVQGIGAAILAPSTLALLTTSFPEGRERTRALSYYASVGGIGGSVGLVLGGILADSLSWRLGFFLNVPIGIAMILAAPRFLPETERRSGQLDLAGAASSTLGMTGVVYGIVRSAAAGWGDPLTIASFGVGVLLLALFVVIERRAPHPIMPLRLFAHPERAGAYAARILVMSGLAGFWFFITQFLQLVNGYSALQAGLAFLPTTIPTFAMAFLVPRLVVRFGSGRLLAASLTSALVGMAWLSRVTPDSAFLTGIALPMVLIGLGQGGLFGPLTAAGVSGVEPTDAGAASGLVNVAHQLGAALGPSVLVTVFAAAGGAALDERTLLANSTSTALTLASAMLALALVVVVAAIVRPGRAVAGRPEPGLASDGRLMAASVQH